MQYVACHELYLMPSTYYPVVVPSTARLPSVGLKVKVLMATSLGSGSRLAPARQETP